MRVTLLLFFIVLFQNLTITQASDSKSDVKPLTRRSAQLIDINSISAWITNYGSFFRHPTTGNSGFEWPKGEGTFAIYASGLWVGAKVQGEVRVAIAEYAYEYAPGSINPVTYQPNDPDDPRYIQYKFNRGDTIDPIAIEDGCPPELIGDQMLWSVYNDADSTAHVNMGTAPLGIEVQQTCHGWKMVGPVSQFIALRWLIINRSPNTLDSAYVTIFSDPDLGYSGDDLIGCDSILSLAYCYNGYNFDDEYGANPPAIGYDLFQGPLVPSPGDTGIFMGERKYGYKNLPMTSFVSLQSNNEINGNPQTGREVHYFMQARWRDGTHMTYGDWGINPNNPPTNYMFSGDPVSGSGWLDEAPADKAFIMSSGPFTMMPGDTQEVVLGVFIARGWSNLNSVMTLKQYDTLIRGFYDAQSQSFNPPIPEVTATALSNEIILYWDTPYNRDSVETYRVYNIALQGDQTTPEKEKYYHFEGYLVYQYDFLDKNNSEVIATYDVVNGTGTIIDLEYDPTTGQFIPVLRIQGNDEGLKRWNSIKENKFSQTAENILYNGTRYWFGVSAYSYNEHSVPMVIESSANLIEITPQSPSIGTKYDGYSTQLLKSVKTGESDGDAFGLVVDPSLVTGNDYTVNFTLDTTNAIYWSVTNTTTSTTLLDSQYFQGTDSAYTDYPIAEGIQWKVLGPPAGINLSIPGPYGPGQGEDGWDFQGNRWFSGYDVGGPCFFHGMFNGVDFFGSDLGPADYVSVELRWAGVTDRSDESALALAAASQAEYPDRWSRAVVYRRDLGYAVQQTLGWVPFSLWDTWAEPERRLKIAFVEMDGENGAAANNLWDMGWSGTDTLFPGENGCREYLFMLNDTYDEDYTEYLNENLDGTYNNSMYAIWPTSRGSRQYLLEPFEMQVFASRVNTPSTVYSFSTDSVKATVGDMNMAKSNIDRINVYPNPYYGTHANERLPTEKWVEFTHLPPNCTIRIFTIAGALVRTIERTGITESTSERWDLQNKAGRFVASGIYIYHIDIPDIGEKTGKIAVFMSYE